MESKGKCATFEFAPSVWLVDSHVIVDVF